MAHRPFCVALCCLVGALCAAAGGDDMGEHDVKSAFEVFDANDDGYVTPRELRRALAVLAGVPTERSGAQQYEATSFVELGDANKDGALDFKEFAHALSTGALSGMASNKGGGQYFMKTNKIGQSRVSDPPFKEDLSGGPNSLVGRTVINPVQPDFKQFEGKKKCTDACEANPAAHGLSSKDNCGKLCGKVEEQYDLNKVHLPDGEK